MWESLTVAPGYRGESPPAIWDFTENGSRDITSNLPELPAGLGMRGEGGERGKREENKVWMKWKERTKKGKYVFMQNHLNTHSSMTMHTP